VGRGEGYLNENAVGRYNRDQRGGAIGNVEGGGYRNNNAVGRYNVNIVHLLTIYISPSSMPPFSKGRQQIV